MSPAMSMMIGITTLFSTYQLNPFELNPLRDVLRPRLTSNASGRRVR